MIVKPKDTTVAYRCPYCGGAVKSVVGVFSLSGDMLKLKCPCLRSEMRMSYTQDGKIRLGVPCFLCGKDHEFTLSRKAVLEREQTLLSCPFTGIDICFIGTKKNVEEQLERADRELHQLLEENDALDFFDEDGGEDGEEEYDGRITLELGSSMDLDYKLNYFKSVIDSKLSDDFKGKLVYNGADSGISAIPDGAGKKDEAKDDSSAADKDKDKDKQDAQNGAGTGDDQNTDANTNANTDANANANTDANADLGGNTNYGYMQQDQNGTQGYGYMQQQDQNGTGYDYNNGGTGYDYGYNNGTTGYDYGGSYDYNAGGYGY